MAIDSISTVNSVKDAAKLKPDTITVQTQHTQKGDDPDIVEQAVLETEVVSDDKKKAADKQNPNAAEQSVSTRSVEEAVKRANNKLTKTHCEFSYNEDVNRVSITVYDNETDEVIREIPPEESLKMLQKLWEIAGLMVDEKR